MTVSAARPRLFNRRYLALFLAIAVATVLAFNFLNAPDAGATNSTTVLAPNDSSIDSANTADNDGQDATVRVAGGVEVGLFKFSTSGLGLPVGATVDAVNVQFFLDPSSTNIDDDTATLYESTNFTSEDTVTWATDKPTRGSSLGTRPLFNSSGVLRPSITFRYTDLTDFNTGSPTTLWLESNTSSRILQVESHENGTQALRPVLWVEYTASGATTTTNPTTTTAAAGTKKLYVAGDLCDPDASSCEAVSNLVANVLDADSYWIPDGDFAYDDSTITQMNNQYGVNFGDSTTDPDNIFSKSRPVEGNHEERAGSGSPSGYCVFFGDTKTDCDADQVLVSDLGTWRMIRIESNGSAPTLTELNDFKNLVDSANTAGDKIVVISHKFRWTSPCAGCHDGIGGHSNDGANVADYWDYAYDNGVDLWVGAHDHKFEVFDTLSKDGTTVTGSGLGSVISGLGGAHPDEGCDSKHTGSLYCAGEGATANDYSENEIDGIAKITLGTSATVEFILENGTANGQVKYSKSFAAR